MGKIWMYCKMWKVKRRSKANAQEMPTNSGVIIDTSRQTRRRYSQDSARTDLIILIIIPLIKLDQDVVQ